MATQAHPAVTRPAWHAGRSCARNGRAQPPARTTFGGTLLGAAAAAGMLTMLGVSPALAQCASGSAVIASLLCDASASNNGATAVGAFTVATGAAASAYGFGANANGTSATAVGQGSVANGATATAFGQSSNANGDATTAIGQGSTAGATTIEIAVFRLRGRAPMGRWHRACSDASIDNKLA
jgi:hypothetical protein